MTTASYTIGVDYGTLSGRAVLVNVATGEIVATSVLEYPHGVMNEALPSGEELPPDWALQHPQDYLDVLATTVPDVLAQAGVAADAVVGLGIDFTACTVVPVDAEAVPLCFSSRFEREPHAYVKLWKHHSAQDLATRITEHAVARGETWLARYGGKISSEWMFPKIWQTLGEAPEVYAATVEFLESGDWVIRQLTGVPARSAALAGYKAVWEPGEGFPSDDFWAGLDPALVGAAAKLPGPYLEAGERAGVLTASAAAWLGLREGTPVAVANSDAYSCAPAVGVTEPGTVVAIVGTSVCTLAMSEEFHEVPGVSGVIASGILPGYYGYEAGQAAAGDMLAWYMRECVPAAYMEAAAREGRDIYEHMESLAARLEPGECGLVALDWWNGNRSVLVDGELSGMMLGMTLATTAADVYRALLESTAFGMRVVIDAFVAHGVEVEAVVISGGISRKSPLLMQIYADVLGRPVRASLTPYGPALGAAVYAAVAAGASGGGYTSVGEAAAAMADRDEVVYLPDAARGLAYEGLFREFMDLHDYFGRGGNDVMKRVRRVA